MWKWSEHTGVNPNFRVAGIRDRVSEICKARDFVSLGMPVLEDVVVCRLHRRIPDDCISVDAAHGAYLADPSRWDHRVFPGDHDLPDLRMDRPLQGAVSVSPDSLQSVYDLVMKWGEPA